MKYCFAKICLLLVFLSIAPNVSAQDKKVTFKASIPNVVGVGEVFSVEFSSNTSGNFTPPVFDDFIEILAGPQTSNVTDVSMINGKFKQESRHTTTYVLRANKEGEFIIGAAKLTVKDKEYVTAPATVKVIKERSSQSGNSQQSGGNSSSTQAQSGRATQAGRSLQKDDILLIPTVDKTNVFKGEAIKLTFKLYTSYPCDLSDTKLPNFNGFWTQQLDTSNYTPQREEYNGKIYTVYTIYQTLLFPQQTGELTIDKFATTAVVQFIKEPTRGQSIIEDLMGGPEIQEERLNLATIPVKISVKEFPEGAPEGFMGAVGEFDLTAEPLPAEIKANSAMTYKVKVSGRGNLPQIQAPSISLPSSFEQYNITTTGSINNSPGGVSGYRQFEVPIIARSEGDFTIGEVIFSYLNPKTASYVTLRIPEKNIRVVPDEKGDSALGGVMMSGLSKEEVKILGNDIRYIKTGAAHLKLKEKVFMSNGMYALCILMITAAFVFLLLYLRNKLREMRNNALMKGRKANKIALQRFRVADQYMKEGNQRGFYEEMLKALWGYMGDKLNIPVAHLTKDNIRGELIKKGVSEEIATCYVNIIGDCECAQYSPIAHGKISDMYISGIEIVTTIESILGKE